MQLDGKAVVQLMQRKIVQIVVVDTVVGLVVVVGVTAVVSFVVSNSNNTRSNGDIARDSNLLYNIQFK